MKINDMEDKRCCENCSDLSRPFKMPCVNTNCICHQEQPKDWRREFYKKFSYIQTIRDEAIGNSRPTVTDFIQQKIDEARKEERQKCREELCFVWRWISRLNGDKPHDLPEENWKTYVATLVAYPSSPYNTGDWYED